MRLLLTQIGLLLILARPAASQEAAGLPPARYLTSFPFRVLNGGVILGRATLEGYSDSLTFIFDTGCPGTSLDSMTAIRLGLRPRTGEFLIRGIGGVRPQRNLDNLAIRLGDLVVDSLAVHVCDYNILSSIYGETIDGIMGYGFFSRYLVKVNYDSSKMYIYTKGDITYPKGGFLLRPSLARLPMLEGQLNDTRDIRSRFYFDTGAGLCLLVSSDFAADSAIFGPKKKPPVKTQAAGLGGTANMQLTTLKKFKLGPYRFRKIPTYIFEDAYDVISYPQLGGLIGNDLLRRFNLILNYARSEIYLTPNSYYRQPFDYSYTGIMIARFDGHIEVTDVVSNSPADKGGFRVGDIVLAINGDTGQDMQTYQTLLRTGPRLKILVRRENGAPALLSLKVESIL